YGGVRGRELIAPSYSIYIKMKCCGCKGGAESIRNSLSRKAENMKRNRLMSCLFMFLRKKLSSNAV
ncbi:hypothetical protein, partial [Bacillus smithii]|uniref:hypothetical protein n=1 Tax=Bacillus smithii TaxID=1479 RepID=UPI0022E02D70